MNPWSFRRKLIYLSLTIIVLLVIVIIPTIFLIHEEPTCSDAKQNGDETGVDCGGSCELLCSFEAVNPTVLWSRAFRVTEDVYSAVAYIENQNSNSETWAPYTFRLYDAANSLIGSREGRTYIQKNKVIAVFEPNINTEGKIPARVSFEFSGKLEWQRNFDVVPNLAITQKDLTGENTKPRIDATIENKSLETAENIELVAIVYDNKENAIAASRTFVDSLSKDQAIHVAFTWPQPFKTTEEICRVPGDSTSSSRPEALGAMLAIDRSGSMASQGKNPPQPLTDVKEAVTSFIEKFKGTDQVGVVSFATTATSPVDAPLSQDYTQVIKAVDGITIGSNSATQYTNIGDAINKSWGELSTHNLLTNRAIILLTDGVANKPEKQGVRNYPETFALNEAAIAKKEGAEIFTIGLGNEVSRSFLESIASSPDHYYAVSDSSDLAEVYDKIAVSFCTTGPAVVEIIPRILPPR
ncbi:MAG TPA: vWA domain-containing protein [Candidatus Nanoarchaeia archaeon]|nr:vWA domain-containing protein [Candidatus Nanoarchaeia archaeon]